MSAICRTCGGEVPNHRPSVLDPNGMSHPGHRMPITSPELPKQKTEIEDLENDYKQTRHRLHTAAVEAAHARKALIEAWAALHYPTITCVATIIDDNLLSLDVCFPGTDRETSTRLAREVNEYLEGLLR